MNELLRAYITLMKYAAIAGLLGGIASFIGPPHHGLIKSLIGVTLGFAICSPWFHRDLRDLLKASDELLEEWERDSE